LRYRVLQQEQVLANEPKTPGVGGAIDGLLAGWMGSKSAPERRTCATLLIAAVILGLLGNALFNGVGSLGVNVALWLAALIATYVVIAHRAGTPPAGGRLLLLALALACAMMMVWRGAETLQAWSLMAAFACLCLAAAMRPAEGFRRLGILELLFVGAGAFVSLAAGLPRVIAALDPVAWWAHRTHRHVFVLGRALVLTTPLVLGFGGLFIAADAVFESRANDLLFVDLSGLRSHVAWTIGTAWVAGGVLWAGVAVKAPPDLAFDVPESKRMQTLEVAVIVGSLVLLFGLFVAVQVRYLFSGEGPVEASLDLTYAEYARRGFFELAAATALLLPVLLALDWALARGQTTHIAFRALAAVLLALLAVVMLSAFERMQVYQDAYGLTELRVYVTVFLVWLGVVFVWFAASVLASRRDRFLAVTIVTAVVALIVLNVLSPDTMIARTNTARAAEGKEFDAEHAAILGPDAVPELINSLDRLSDTDACTIASALLERWRDVDLDPRGWNYARAEAIDAVKDNEARLEAACRSARS
jgi:hypothetical protein